MKSTFEKGQRDAIIRVASYPRFDFEVALIRSTSSDHNLVRSSIAEPFCSTALAPIGILECLPTELLRIVCLELDIRSYFNFRQTNRRAREIASSLYEYHNLVKHGLESLRAVLRTGIHPYVTISDLYRALCTRRCDVCCGEFGGFLFLPSVTRCCFNCIEASNHLRVISVAALAKRAGIPRRKLHSLSPILRTLPGTYSMEQRSRKSRSTLVSHQRAFGALCRLGLSTEAAASVLSDIGETHIGRFMASTPLPLFDPITTEIEHGICCKGCQIAVEEEVDDGSMDLYRRRDRVYSKEGYLNHFPKCPQSISLWNSSKEGTMSVDEPKFTRDGGFLAHLRS
jgi:hypothetical protein